jgi:hypothetical protein
MFVPCIIRRSKNNQHYAPIFRVKEWYKSVHSVGYFYYIPKQLIGRSDNKETSKRNSRVTNAGELKIEVKGVHPVASMMKTTTRFISPPNTTYIPVGKYRLWTSIFNLL